jgi:hypothetical protein
VPNNTVPNSSSSSSSSHNNNSSALSSEQIQAQLLMSMAKSRDSNAMEQLHALFQRQVFDKLIYKGTTS